jgi:hypothetical protein
MLRLKTTSKYFRNLQILTATGNDGENINKEWMYHEIRRSPSNIIPKQKRCGTCKTVMGTVNSEQAKSPNLERMMIMVQYVNSEIYRF